MLHESAPTGRSPALRRWWNTMPLHYISNCLLAHLKAQFAQFTLDLAVAPIAVLSSQAHDQSLEFVFGPWSPAALAWSKGPLPSHQLTMPFEKWFRLNHANQFTPLPHSATHDPFQLDRDDCERQLLDPQQAHRPVRLLF